MLDIPGAEWGPRRIVSLLYAADPIVFFKPEIFFRKPEWLKGARGPDMSADLAWYPVVTFLQTLVDMIVATQSDLSPGHGHVYHSSHYIDAWLEVAAPPGWTTDQVTGLKETLEDED
jgi:uncharacterized membrane protein